MFYKIKAYKEAFLYLIYDKLLGIKYDKKKFVVLNILIDNQYYFYQCDIFKI